MLITFYQDDGGNLRATVTIDAATGVVCEQIIFCSRPHPPCNCVGRWEQNIAHTNDGIVVYQQ